ncbi:fasciclin domain-containing protein [Streptomyces sp. Tu 2975]|uniref:fasciclin domain-containing protein n=1 Tax=Streptomyces sp. Tu 2975 TaxID=2676871 RepID=UPI001356A251|nr:fasciclin domain-containing protein [Streptomyces sp. Tu 2975]QIP84183.1 fasciclin domain-containing protein [Streptomyces sp. Tu 2975]
MNTNRFRSAALAGAAGLLLPLGLVALAPVAQAEGTGQPFGPACASLPTSGPGSPAEMAGQPVATAAASNPELSTLATAVEKAGLVDTLDNAQNITVFAPTNDAFEKIPKADLDAILNDKAQLTNLLTYHVVEEKVTVDKLPNGTFTSMQGGQLTTSGSGDRFKVNDSSSIVCGDVETKNATVHLIDTVLMPPS